MKTKSTETSAEWYYFIPLVIILAILPLIVYLKVMPLSGPSYEYWTGVVENYDFFSYYKGICLIITASLGIFMVVVRLFLNDPNLIKKDLNPFYIPAGVYLFFVIGSTIASESHSVAISGFPDRYEGVYVLVAYLLIFFITTALVSNEKNVKLMLGSLLVGAAIIGIIGLLQYIGYDPLKTDFAKSAFLPEQYMNIADELEFQFDKYTVYATLFHYNYVGSYTAMLLPLCFSLFILAKDMRFKISAGLMTALMGIIWLGSNARSGIVGVGLALFVFMIIINKIVKKHWKFFATSIVVVIVIFIGLNQMSNGFVATRISSLFSDVKVILGVAKSSISASDSIPLKNIVLNGNRGTVVTDTESLSFVFQDNALTFGDSNNNPIETRYDLTTGVIALQSPAYQDYSLTFGQMESNLVLKLDKGDIHLIFALEPTRIALINNKGNEVSLEPVESWGFEGNERLGSSRGYIWSRSLPLLKNTLVFGYGPDTFAIAFPQHDIFGKMYAYHGDMWQVVDKPHNLYLQIAINTGIISLLAFLFLVGYYLYRSFRIYLSNSYDDFLSQAGVGVFVAIVGYLGAAFFNDSVVSVAPVFWCLLGLGVSINHIVSNRPAKTR